MPEIDPLGTNFYYSGVQNASKENVHKKEKSEELKSTRKTKFADLLNKTEEPEPQFSAIGLPPEILKMPFDDAVIYLKDNVDLAGNDLSEQVNTENIQKFKQAVSNFVKFIVMNNYQVSSKRKQRMGHDLTVPSRTKFFYSTYSIPPHKADPKYQIEVINKKIDELTRYTLQNQMNNLKILAQVNEIKGLIVDLMSS